MYILKIASFPPKCCRRSEIHNYTKPRRNPTGMAECKGCACCGVQQIDLTAKGQRSQERKWRCRWSTKLELCMRVPAPSCHLWENSTSADIAKSPGVLTVFLPPSTAFPALTVSRMLLSLRPKIAKTVATTVFNVPNARLLSSLARL